MQRIVLDTDFTFDVTKSETDLVKNSSSNEQVFMKVPKGTVVFVYSRDASPKVAPASSPVPSSVNSPQQRKEKKEASPRKVYQPKGAAPSSNGAVPNGLSRGAHSNGTENGVSPSVAAPKSASGKVPPAETPYVYYERDPQQEKWLQARREAMRKEKEEADKRYRERVEREKKKKEEEELKRRAEAEARGETYDPNPKSKDKGRGKGRDSNNNNNKSGKAKGKGNGKGNFSRERKPNASPKSAKVEKEDSPRSCWICSSAEHLSRYCPDRCKRVACTEQYGVHTVAACNYPCELCQGKGHDPRFCEKRCTLCKRDAHLPSKCPVECSLCGEKASHRERNCPHSYHNRHFASQDAAQVSVKA